MALVLDIVEQRLLSGAWPDDTTTQSAISGLAQKVVQGKFKEVLTSTYAKALLKLNLPYDDLGNAPIASWFSLVHSAELSDEENELLRVVIGVAFLHAFVQANWTGPDLDIEPIDVISNAAETSPDGLFQEEALNRVAIAELAYGGEPAYHLTRAATFLRLAQILFEAPFQSCCSAPWWRLRCTRIHELILDEPVALEREATSSVQDLYSHIASERDTAGRLTLELGLLEHHLRQDKLALEHFVQAAKHTGLEYELTGALGKRTKFQQNALSQLVLLAESRIRNEGGEATAHETQQQPLSDQKSPPSPPPAQPDNSLPARAAVNESPAAPVTPSPPSPLPPSAAVVPETLALNDDTLLERTEFTSSSAGASDTKLGHLDPSSQPALHPLDQCILLSLCLNVKNTSPTHGLTTAQMAPYVERVISHPRNWSVHTMALLLRSRLEASRTRTVERSVLQLQALVDQMPTADSTLTERLQYFHCLPMPSKWELERELAMRFLDIGVVKSAMEIFERLEMWEEVVKCWQAMERPDKGIAIVRDLLEGKKKEADVVITRGKSFGEKRQQGLDIAREAKLWCLLGDLEPKNALENYERAWSISKQKSGRAMRSLGGYYFSRGDYAKAIDALRKAVSINPLLSRPWFILGCSCVREERWAEARDAFARCVSIDDEDGESWNNLASVYLRMGASPNDQKGDEEKAKAGDENEDQEVGAKDETLPGIPFSNKLLAFRALGIGLKYSYNNWRMWTNYMIVALDVGEFAEACRAQARVVEERGDKDGAAAVDEDLLDKLVDAVTRAPSDSPESQAQAQAVDKVASPEANNPAAASATGRSPNEGYGLLPRVTDLFERVILSRVSSRRIFRSYARLLTWQGQWAKAVDAYLDAYRLSSAATMEKGAEPDEETWREAVSEVEEIVDVLRNFGPRAAESRELKASHGDVSGYQQLLDAGSVTGSGKWKTQARSIVRIFMARHKDAFEDNPYWEHLTQLQEELRK